MKPARQGDSRRHRVPSDAPFFGSLAAICGTYVFLIVAMLAAAATYTTPDALLEALRSPEAAYALRLSLITCTMSAVVSLWVAAPIGYLLARVPFRGRNFVDAVVDIPIVLPPLVVGLCLLILFQTPPGRAVDRLFAEVAERLTGVRTGVVFEIPAVVLSQFMVACAFAVRTMRVVFEQIDPRYEQVALTLGCNRAQAFSRVVFPQAAHGMVAAGLLAWARSLGEFGPILVFAGATSMKTEVLSTRVFLELTVGDLAGAVAASLVLVVAALVVLLVARLLGLRATAI